MQATLTDSTHLSQSLCSGYKSLVPPYNLISCTCVHCKSMRRDRGGEVTGIDFTLWLHCADSLPLIFCGGVEELISYSITMERSHLSPRKPNSLTPLLIDNTAGVDCRDAAGRWDSFNQPRGWSCPGCFVGNEADFSKELLCCTGVKGRSVISDTQNGGWL